MKMVSYVVKEVDLTIQSLDRLDFRLGWLEDSWIIDIGLAQQWLIYYRQLSVSFLFPMKPIHCFFTLHDSFVILAQIYQAILREDWKNLFIHGEPISLPVKDVQLLPLPIDPSKLIAPSFLGALNASVHPSSVFGFNRSITNVKKAVPGVAFLLGNERQLIGCCLNIYWLRERQWIPSLGPYLYMTDQWQSLTCHLLTIRRNHQIIGRQEMKIWDLFTEEMKLHGHVSPGDMISLVFSSFMLDLEIGDQVEMEMKGLGLLQNRVDKP